MMNQIDRILNRRSHYRNIFNGKQSSNAVLADLKRFCRGQSSPLMVSNGVTDTFATAVAIGRQEVFNRIVQMINIDDAELLKIKEFADD